MVGVAHAKDGELGLVHGIARAPVEGEGSALRVDIAGSPIGEQLIVAALQVGALGSAGKDLYVVEEVGHGIAAGGVVGVEAVIAGEIEQQPG